MTSHSNTLISSAEVNNRISFELIENELLNFLRTNLTDRLNRAEINTETFTADSTGLYTLTKDLDNKGRHKVMAVNSLTVNGVAKRYLFDYYIGFRNDDPNLGKFFFWNSPAIGATISIVHQSTYGFVFTESPRVDLTSNSYPRVSVQIQNSTPTDVAIGGKVTKHTFTIMLTVVDLTRTQVTNLVQEIKDLFITESVKHGFHSFTYIRNPKLTPLIVNGEDPNDVVYLQQVELEIPNEYEFSK